jgi:xylose dehydrogenase (NAD/NADP)
MYVGDEENYRWSPEMGGGALYDVGCYTINAARLVFNEEPISIYARAHFHPRFKVDLSTSMLLEFPRNRVALLDCSFESQFQSYFEIVGTEGKLTLPRSYSAKLLDVPILVLKGDRLRTMTIPSANQYTRMVEHFGECIIQNHPPRYPAEDSDKTMQVIDAAFESIRTGRPVRL